MIQEAYEAWETVVADAKEKMLGHRIIMNTMQQLSGRSQRQRDEEREERI